jgi:hypothetical protein
MTRLESTTTEMEPTKRRAIGEGSAGYEVIFRRPK